MLATTSHLFTGYFLVENNLEQVQNRYRHGTANDMEQRLCHIARSSEWFAPALRAVRDLKLSSWCIGAGAVRNLVWDALHDYSTPTALADLDVAYFDASDLAPERESEFQCRVHQAMPEIPWEVTNQAAVHQWFEGYFGHAVEPLRSLRDAVASWPEYATSVGLWLDQDDAIEVIAPHGLDDLFNCVVRRNPTRVSMAAYHRRIEEKKYALRWPRVEVVYCER
jgi:hypothetical protein